MEIPYSAGHATPMPDSLWAKTMPDPPPDPALLEHISTQIVIIGAGFMGLATALALAEAGVDVVVIEAAKVGWGASGRNNGLLAAGLKRDPDETCKILGTEIGERLLRFSGDAPTTIFNLVDQHEIECDLSRDGWIQAAHSSRAMRLVERRVQQWQALGANVELIPTGGLSKRLGTDYYTGAWFDPRGGSLNPLAFVRGLAAAARAAGIEIYACSPAQNIEKCSGGWTVTTPEGSLRCEQLVCCTNAYNDSIASLHGVAVPVRTAQIASTPLTQRQAQSILPGGESASDTQRLLTSFRLTADRRLIMGGASATAGDENAQLFDWLYRGARERFPHLGTIKWEYGWSGYLALTDDHLPQILKIDEGYFAGIGCNGRGIAMATVTGQEIAKLICGQQEIDSAVPVNSPRRIFGFGLRRPGVAVSVAFNRLLDISERRMGKDH